MVLLLISFISLEQNVIPHLMAYAGCIGNGYTACNTGKVA